MNSSRFYSTGLEEELEAVRKIIIESITSRITAVSNPLKQLVSAKSKLLRPAFLILSSKFGNYDTSVVYPLAASIEMLHTASLIHDDIIDRASTRRGQSSLHKIIGAGQSVLMGDYLLSKGYSLILHRLDKENQLLLANIISHLCESEIAESSSVYMTDVTEREYIRRIAGKTASLFALSCHVGASESGCSQEYTSALRRCGYCTGMAFQIIDDILDFRSSTAVLGKPAGNDLKEGTFTLPVLHAIKTGGIRFKNELVKINKKKGFLKDRQVIKVIRMTENLGGIDFAITTAELYTKRALREIMKLPEGNNRNNLSELVQTLLLRKY